MGLRFMFDVNWDCIKIKEYLSLKEACLYMGIGIGTLYKWLEEGLSYYKYGRRRFIKKSDIDEFMLEYKED